MHLKKGFEVLLILGLVRLSFAQEYSCDEVVDKEKLLQGKPNCGENQCRCDGELARCVGNRTTHVVPRLEGIVDLYVACYEMSNLNRSSFVNIKNLPLQKLHLLRNEIGNIAEDIFENIDNLTFLQISDNAKINDTSLYTAFKSLNKQLTVNLTFNNIGLRHVTDNFFQNLNKSNVVYLSLADNTIRTLNLTVFSQLPFLQHLRLDGNWITNITGEGQLNNLHTLDLRNNKLYSNGVNFCLDNNNSLFPNLKELLLGSNYLNQPDKNLTSWKCLKSLNVLSLSNNTIKILNISFFSMFTSLKTLDVGSNWIQNVIPGKYPPKLEEIDFRNNQFVAFPPELCEPNSSSVFENIHKLNFSRNYIQKILTDRWQCIPNITVLDFSKNDVSVVKNNTFANFTSLKELYLDNMIPWVKNIEPAAFNSSSLLTLSLRFDWIDFSKTELHVIFKFCPNVKRLDISYNYFLGVSEQTIVEILLPLKDLEVLKAQRISLKKFPITFLTDLKKLKYLDVNRNLLDTIQFTDAFNNQTLNLSIRHISVAEGDINVIDQSAFPVSIMNALKELDISDNEFVCNCKMQWFRDKVKDGKVGKIRLLHWPHKYVCRSPTSLVGTLLKDYEPDEVCWHIKPIIVAFIAIGCCLFVFIVLSVTAYYNWWYIQYYWYRLGRRRLDMKSRKPEEQPILDEIKYDGCVVNDPADNDFVHYTFRTLMENKFNYKLHIWERDAGNGARVDVILDAIYASKHVIVIVSNNLMKDQWCKFQADVAIARGIELGRKCLLFVVLENIDFKAISKTWCVFLTKIPTAYWGKAEDGGDIKRKLFELTVKKHLGDPLDKLITS